MFNLHNRKTKKIISSIIIILIVIAMFTNFNIFYFLVQYILRRGHEN